MANYVSNSKKKSIRKMTKKITRKISLSQRQPSSQVVSQEDRPDSLAIDY